MQIESDTSLELSATTDKSCLSVMPTLSVVPTLSGGSELEKLSGEKNGEFKHAELGYLELVKDILEHGDQRMDRTGTGTLSRFGTSLRFSLTDNVFPLLTTKKVFWRGVVEELLWFISGSTDATRLAQRGVNIWNQNGSRQTLDKLGLTENREGDLGPVYGFQWRHWGANYKGCDCSYEGKGIDQVKQAIETIKTDPFSRRIVVSAWNPSDLPFAALPPCHLLFQFSVSSAHRLSCIVYMRSVDVGLGLPFNIASYALLTRLIAQVTDTEPGELIMMLGDTHVYLNHVEGLKEQCRRKPKPFPKLHIDPTVKDIDQFTLNHLRLEEYEPLPPISLQMSV